MESVLSVKIRNVKNIKELMMELPLKPDLYAITGINGIGKSTLLSCISPRLKRPVSFSFLDREAADGGEIEYQIDNEIEIWRVQHGKWVCQNIKDLPIRGFQEGSLTNGTRFLNISFYKFNYYKKMLRVNPNLIIPADDFVKENLKLLSGKVNRDLKETLGKIILVATYIKRYSNLYLLTENKEYTYMAELRLCFAEIKQVLDELGIITDFIFEIPENEKVGSKFCIECCSIWELAIEYLDFQMSEVLFLANPIETENSQGLNFIISIIKESDINTGNFNEYIKDRFGEENIGDISVYETNEGLVIELENRDIVQ